MPKLIFNAEASKRALRRAADLLDDMTPVYQDIGEYMVEATRKRFQTGTAPDGTAWAPKSQATLDRYRRLGYGSLNRPLIGPSRSLSKQILRLVDKNSVTIGSNLIYSRVMQEGAAKGAFGSDSRGRPIPWGRIPARTWLGLSDADELAIVDIAEEYIETRLDTGE
ncbi:MAG: phage virion morphogenesis protein [Sphingomonadaceae bacterium]|nr:phage virion morphogenesis protein [Sphingomonadaceae bacterium]